MAWKEKPSVDHLRVFGCDAYAHLPKGERGKFDTKASKCILLGYGEETKGYRLYDVNEKKVLYSRDVRFNEHSNDDGHGTSDDQSEGYKLIIDMSSDENSDTETEEQPEVEVQDDAPIKAISQREKAARLGHTKLITCFSDSLATNVDPGGGNKKKNNK